MPAARPPLPLLDPRWLHTAILRTPKGEVSGSRLLAQAVGLTEQLPQTQYIINLCEERHPFLVALLAAMMGNAITLLPPNRLEQTLKEIAADHPDPLCIIDSPKTRTPPRMRRLELAPPYAGAETKTADIPRIAPDQAPLCAFTSGTTGRPQPHCKRWKQLMIGARCGARRLGIDERVSVVATVPAQHMYGLELSVLIPLASGAAAYSGRPFFPEDVRTALQQVPEPRVLVTTPLHLAALTRAKLQWPRIQSIVSATAPLSPERAARAQSALSAEVLEVYGCTEAGSLANRRAFPEEPWTWYDCVQARQQGESIEVSGDCLSETVILSDRLSMDPDGRFRLLGRSQDMVNIAGKRASLSDLNTRLNGIEGVEDGAFLQPDDPHLDRARLIAFVVAPRLSRDQVLGALRRQLDPAFVPRTIHFVSRLPRNETGKLPRAELQALLRAREAKK